METVGSISLELKAENFLIIPNYIFTSKALTSEAKLIYAELLYSAKEGLVTTITDQEIAECLTLPMMQVSSAIRSLEKKGYIKIKITETFFHNIREIFVLVEGV